MHAVPENRDIFFVTRRPWRDGWQPALDLDDPVPEEAPVVCRAVLGGDVLVLGPADPDSAAVLEDLLRGSGRERI